MQRKPILRLLLPILVMASMWSACNKSDFDQLDLADHNAEFAFPLFNTTLGLDDLLFKVLNDTLSGDTLFINPDNTMTLYYTGDVAEKPASDIFQTFPSGPAPIPDTLYQYPFNSPDGVTIRDALFKTGMINLVIFNNTGQNLTGTFTVEQIKKNGQKLTIPLNVPNNPVFPYSSPIFDLTGWRAESENNELTFRYELYTPDGVRVKIPEVSPGISGVLVVFQNLTLSYLEGYWGYSSYPLTRDTIEIDINQTDLDGGITIVNPKVTMLIANSWGFPTRGYIKYLSFIGQNGEEIPLITSAFNNDSTIDFNYPHYPNEIGQTKYTEVTLDENNSNIASIFNSQPTRLIYEVEGISNAEHDPTVIGFLTDTSSIKLGVRVELLLEGTAKNFGAEQEMDLNFGEYSDLDTSKIQSVEFKLVTENSTPISADMQIVFLNEAGQAVDSLFTDGAKVIMQSAPITNGVASGTTREENFIQMSATRFDRIRQTKKAVLKTSFTTAQGGTVPVKLLATNKAIVKMGIKVKTRY
ncbi:MAG TPA: hypothetical protein PLO67_18345 [Saprospiraceae bacterium]|nr:hypothetical protein [Saprospiraceae bacterium]HPI08585.1 hypothetical protein [Saprospiraceae bacterium]